MSGAGSGTGDLAQEAAHRVPGALGDLAAVRERDALVLELTEDVRRLLVEPEVRAERAGAVPQLPDVEQRVAGDQRRRGFVQQGDVARGVPGGGGHDPQPAADVNNKIYCYRFIYLILKYVADIGIVRGCLIFKF